MYPELGFLDPMIVIYLIFMKFIPIFHSSYANFIFVQLLMGYFLNFLSVHLLLVYSNE